MLNTIFVKKLEVTQGFDQDGKRWPLTRVKAYPLVVKSLKSQEKHGYQAVVFKLGEVEKLREVRFEGEPQFKAGDQLKLEDLVKAGDQVKVTGPSKGRGFAGVIKRWGFKGGPRTHGQSDRERAPGSIGQGTDPSKVWKGKKMPGRMGGKNVSVLNLAVFKVDPETQEVLIRGLVPGARGTFLTVSKTGEIKNFKGEPSTSSNQEKENKKEAKNTKKKEK